MKIKRQLYCLVDKNNKPDYRYLFEDPQDASRKLRYIKNSTRGETIFLSKEKRDFFVDGVKRDFVSSEKKVQVRRGCWTSLKVKKLSLIDEIKPEKTTFKKVETAQAHQLDFSKQRAHGVEFSNPDLKLPSVIPIPNPFLGFDWEQSFLRTKTFAAVFATLCLVTITSIFYIHNQTSVKVTNQLVEAQIESTEKTVANQTKVLGAKDEKLANQFDEELDKFVVEALQQFEGIRAEELEHEVKKIVSGSPMEQMAPLIAKQDRTVAAFLIGIAKKESNLGRRVPVLNGQDCFNYWGYRAVRQRMGSGGHTCFNSPEDAIDTVAGRLKDLVQADIDTPQEMVLWKCGSNCYKDSGASKWIRDVNMFFSEINNKNEG